LHDVSAGIAPASVIEEDVAIDIKKFFQPCHNTHTKYLMALNQLDSDGYTPLHIAIISQLYHISLALIAISSPQSLNTTDTAGNTAIAHAVAVSTGADTTSTKNLETHRLQVLRSLLGRKADALIPDDEGIYPHMRVEDVQTAEILMGHIGASCIKQRDDAGRNMVMFLCASQKKAEILSRYLQNKLPNHHFDAQANRKKALKAEEVRTIVDLVSQSVNVRDDGDRTALHHAAYYLNVPAVEMLVNANADPIVTTDKDTDMSIIMELFDNEAELDNIPDEDLISQECLRGMLSQESLKDLISQKSSKDLLSLVCLKLLLAHIMRHDNGMALTHWRCKKTILENHYQ
jgi:ankyrin repeat protein